MNESIYPESIICYVLCNEQGDYLSEDIGDLFRPKSMIPSTLKEAWLAYSIRQAQQMQEKYPKYTIRKVKIIDIGEL